MLATAKLHDKNPDQNHDKTLDTESIHSSVPGSSVPDSSVSAHSQKLAIQKVTKVCVMHGLPSGSPGDLGTFMRSLNHDKLLAMNFWSLVVKITDQISNETSIQTSAHENGSNPELLETIAQGVTGRSVAEVEAVGGEPKWLIQQMAAMLAGEDVQIPAAMPVPAAAVSADTSRAAAVEPPAFVSTPTADLPEPAEAQSQPFLVRTARTARTARTDQADQPVLTDRDISDRSRLVLEPEAAASKPLPGQRALFGQEAQEEKASPFRVPLEGYGATVANGSASRIAIALLIVVALGGGAFFVRGNGAAMQQKFGPSVRARYNAAWHGAKWMGGWVSSEVSGR
jgi:hypothetical protein